VIEPGRWIGRNGIETMNESSANAHNGDPIPMILQEIKRMIPILECPRCLKCSMVTCDCPIEGPGQGAYCPNCGLTHMDAWPPASPEFIKFSKIPRLKRDIIITEKIDGTNAQIYITEANRIFAGSRKRWLTAEADNFGFFAWVMEHHRELLHLGRGRHFGEWWGTGIQRGYGLDDKRFSLFNVSRWIDPTLFDNIKVRGILSDEAAAKRRNIPLCCRVVPVLRVGPFRMSTIISALNELQYSGSRAAPSFMNPEGIVIYHTAGGNLFKVTLENDDKPKGKDNV